jgi:hypothetical protein
VSTAESTVELHPFFTFGGKVDLFMGRALTLRMRSCLGCGHNSNGKKCTAVPHAATASTRAHRIACARGGVTLTLCRLCVRMRAPFSASDYILSCVFVLGMADSDSSSSSSSSDDDSSIGYDPPRHESEEQQHHHQHAPSLSDEAHGLSSLAAAAAQPPGGPVMPSENPCGAHEARAIADALAAQEQRRKQREEQAKQRKLVKLKKGIDTIEELAQHASKGSLPMDVVLEATDLAVKAAEEDEEEDEADPETSSLPGLESSSGMVAAASGLLIPKREPQGSGLHVATAWTQAEAGSAGDDHMSAAASSSKGKDEEQHEHGSGVAAMKKKKQQQSKKRTARGVVVAHLLKERQEETRMLTTIPSVATTFAQRKGARDKKYLKEIDLNGYAPIIKPGEVFSFGDHLWRVVDIVSPNQWVQASTSNPPWPKWKTMTNARTRPDWVGERADLQPGTVIADNDTINRMSFVNDQFRKHIWGVPIRGGEAIMKVWPRTKMMPNGKHVVVTGAADFRSYSTPPFIFSKFQVVNQRPLVTAVVPVRLYRSFMKGKLEDAEEGVESDGGDDYAQEEDAEAAAFVNSEQPQDVKYSASAVKMEQGVSSAAAAAGADAPNKRRRASAAPARSRASTPAAAAAAAAASYSPSAQHPYMHETAKTFLDTSLLPRMQQQVEKDQKGDVSVMFARWVENAKCIDEPGGLLNLVKRLTENLTEIKRFSKSKKKEVSTNQYGMSQFAMVEFGARVYLVSTDAGLQLLRETQQRLTANSIAGTKCSVV